jgi:hypothetical protein
MVLFPILGMAKGYLISLVVCIAANQRFLSRLKDTLTASEKPGKASRLPRKAAILPGVVSIFVPLIVSSL